MSEDLWIFHSQSRLGLCQAPEQCLGILPSDPKSDPSVPPHSDLISGLGTSGRTSIPSKQAREKWRDQRKKKNAGTGYQARGGGGGGGEECAVMEEALRWMGWWGKGWHRRAEKDISHSPDMPSHVPIDATHFRALSSRSRINDPKSFKSLGKTLLSCLGMLL